MNREAIVGINSSVGQVGVHRGTFDRLRIGHRHFSADPNEVLSNWERAKNIGRRHTSPSRIISRGIVGAPVIENILANQEIRREAEVVVDVSDYLDLPSGTAFLTSLGYNGKDRRLPDIEIDQLVEETTSGYWQTATPIERVTKVVEGKSGVFIDNFNEEQIVQVFSLWGKTFGWTEEEVKTFKSKLEADKRKKPSERSIWFSGIVMDGKIVTASMAERTSIPGPNGKFLDTIESTEWVVDHNYRLQHLMTATSDMLNAQVIRDLGNSENSTMPFIYAEVNLHPDARADRVAKGAGFDIASRDVNGNRVTQILVQHVGVGNGIPGMPLRDFAFVHLTPGMINAYREQVNEMVPLIKVA